MSQESSFFGDWIFILLLFLGTELSWNYWRKFYQGDVVLWIFHLLFIARKIKISTVHCQIDCLFKMAANVPRWPPKKCQPHFFITLWYIFHKKTNLKKSTQKSHWFTNNDTKVYTMCSQFSFTQICAVYFNLIIFRISV